MRSVIKGRQIMGGIEVLAATVVFIVGTVGLIRGPSKEVGVTMALVVLLAVLAQFETLIPTAEMPIKVNDIIYHLKIII